MSTNILNHLKKTYKKGINKIQIFFVLAALIFLYLVKTNRNPLKKINDFSQNRKFLTAKGFVDIDEINENIFEPNDYILIHNNDLIPVLKKNKPESCQKVFSEWKKIADKGLTFDPPKEIPDPEAFLLNGYSKETKTYYNNVPKNSEELIHTWSEEYVESLIKSAKANKSVSPHLPYKKESFAVDVATKFYNIVEQEGAVIGSLSPWAEAYILANGAKHVTTIDYQNVNTLHPQMSFIYAPDLPSESEKLFEKYDFILSFSSIEHSGLGRYGDPLDPIGDIREMNKIRCMLKPKGLLFLGVPTGVDSITYNAHRIYGRIRLAMMFEGFKLLNVFYAENVMSKEEMEEAYATEGVVKHDLFVLQKNEKF